MARRNLINQYAPGTPGWMDSTLRASGRPNDQGNIINTYGNIPSTPTPPVEMTGAGLADRSMFSGSGFFARNQDMTTGEMAKEMRDADIKKKYDQFKNPQSQQPLPGTSDLSSRIKNMLSTSSQPQEENPLALAGGGPLMPDRMHIVGERGPELIVPNGQGGYHVVPSEQTQQILMQRGMQGIKGHYDGTDIEDPNKTYSNIVMGRVPDPVQSNVVMGKVPQSPVYSNIAMGKVPQSDTYSNVVMGQVPRTPQNEPEPYMGVGQSEATAPNLGGVLKDRLIGPDSLIGSIPESHPIRSVGGNIIGTLQANSAKPYVPATPNDSLAKIADRFRVGSAPDGSEVAPVIGGPPVFQERTNWDGVDPVGAAIRGVERGGYGLANAARQTWNDLGTTANYMLGGNTGTPEAQAATPVPSTQPSKVDTVANPFNSTMNDVMQPIKADFSFRPEPTQNGNGTPSNAPSHIMEVINGTNRQYARFTPGSAFPQMYASPEEAIAGRSFVQQAMDQRNQANVDAANIRAAGAIRAAKERAGGETFKPVTRKTESGAEISGSFNPRTAQYSWDQGQLDDQKVADFDKITNNEAAANFLNALDDDTKRRVLQKSTRKGDDKKKIATIYEQLFSNKR